MKVLARDPDTGRFETRVVCKSCEVLSINGHACHEIGCPDAWRDENRGCKWCGDKFAPETRHQKFCTQDCARSYST